MPTRRQPPPQPQARPRPRQRVKRRPRPAPTEPPSAAPPSPGPTSPPGTPSPGPRPTLDEAVQFLNGLYVPGSLRVALAVAAYVRDRLLRGEEGFNPQLDAPSLRELAGRTDLSFSPSYLSNAIGVTLQHPLLEPSLAERLTFSHHRVLLGVPPARDKNQLAALAVRKQLDVEDLRREVHAYRKRHGLPPIGHPVDDPIVHTLRRLYRGAGELNQDLERPSASPTAEARRIYRDLMKRLKKTDELLREERL